jgi:hypothetical protein
MRLDKSSYFDEEYNIMQFSPAILVCAMVLLSTASAITYSFDSGAGRTSVDTKVSIQVPLEDSFKSAIRLSADALEHKISSSGDFKEEHWTRNNKGDAVGVGANLTGAKHYDYTWDLKPLPGENLTARETLSVDRAKSISAFAEARNSQGDLARSELNLVSGTGDASLKGYTNKAWIVNGDLKAAQQFSEAKGDVIDMKSFDWKRGWTDIALSSVDTEVKSGTVSDYSDLSKVENASRNISSSQFSHIDLVPSKGSFNGSSSYKDNSGELRRTRTSNYGTKYGLSLRAQSYDVSYNWLIKEIGGKVTGTIAYHVNKSNPLANKIQSAINASSDHDSILVGSGTYNENLVIDKAINIAGSDNSIIDGQKKDSVIRVWKGKDVILSRLKIQNGSALCGGGIYNEGDLIINNCDISGNNARYGGGVHSYYGFTMNGGNIAYNNATYCGGGVYNKDIFTMNGGNIAHNNAKYGSGVYNSANFTMNGGNIAHNNATYCGGGVYSNSKFTMNGGNIAHNNAKYGSGVYNYYGFTMNGGNIAHNNATNDGGGVYNYYGFTMNGGNIVHNNATNGAGVYNDHGHIYLNSGDISHNHAFNEGGGIFDWYRLWSGVSGNLSIVHDNIAGDDKQIRNIRWSLKS